MSTLLPEAVEKTLESSPAPSRAAPTVAPAAAPIAPPEPAGPRLRVLWLSTIAFTLLFAVWLMLGVLGVKIKADAQLMVGEAAVASLTESELKVAVESRFEWLLSIAILSGSLLRLSFGIWADRFGGRVVMTSLLLTCALPTLWLGYAHSYTELMVCAMFFGLAGNGFSLGIAWNSAWFPPERKGTALGIFGAGNVGAAGTKLLIILAPAVLTMVPAAGYWGGWIPGGWRVVPVMYAMMLAAMAAAIWFFTPENDRKPGQGRPMVEMLAPLRYSRVWRFGFYYVVVFGAYVALSAWLPNYYVNTYKVDLQTAALLTSLYIFPASLLRPVGGWLSDLFGPRFITYGVFICMILTTIPLSLPTHLLSLGVGGFTFLIMVTGVAMGIGKASVYKYIPNYFPHDVGAVGGLVGLLGAFGGFVLPKTFGWLGRETGFPQAAFIAMFLLSATSLAWLHVVVQSLRAQDSHPGNNQPLVDNAKELGSQSDI